LTVSKTFVLVVDDDAATRLLVENLLNGDAYEVEAVGTISAARHRLTEVTPDLILMDIELPDGDGLKLTGWIKGNSRTKSIPVVALTSYTNLEKRTAASEVGCAGFISKPIETGRFVKRVEGYLAALR
jgi:CheY-like chemotaxis protein